VKSGIGNPMRANRITPMCGSMYFSIPCVKKISPTAIRMNKVRRLFEDGSRSDLKLRMFVAPREPVNLLDVESSFIFLRTSN
jgi:hypothetical protein